MILISTQEDGEPSHMANEPLQMDATYLAANLAFVPKSKRDTFNMDTSNGKPLF